MHIVFTLRISLTSKTSNHTQSLFYCVFVVVGTSVESLFLFVLLGYLLDLSVLVLLFDESKLDTISSGHADQWLLSITNNENVGQTGGEGVTLGVLNVGNLV